MKKLISLVLLNLMFGCNVFVKQAEPSFHEKLDLEEESSDWKRSKTSGGELQCPCCDYFTLEERGVYDICPICFWEDDGIDLDNLDQHSGPNHISLREGRQNFEKYGACDSTMIKNVLSEDQRKNFKFEKRTID